MIEARSGGDSSPDGEMTTARAARPRRASSSATQPPRELPTTAGASKPRRSSLGLDRISQPGRGRSGAIGQRGLSPKPGRSIATTSWRPSRAASTGCQERQLSPSPCTRTSGCPLPPRWRVSFGPPPGLRRRVRATAKTWLSLVVLIVFLFVRSCACTLARTCKRASDGRPRAGLRRMMGAVRSAIGIVPMAGWPR